MTKRDKTTVEDIIGIVHTDETTNSVEEVKKLRGRTNKRFNLDSEIGFIDTQKCGGDTMTLFEVVVELNKLNEENEKLKQNCKNYEWYKQYKAVLNENEQLKHNNKMLSMKMSEVYTKYCLLKEFSEDTNPNDAVKRVLSELMQITKEYR